MTTYSYGQLVGFAQNAGFQGQSAYTAAAIAMAESSGNPNAIAYNDGGKGYNSYGLMQINGVNDKTVGGAINALDPQTSFNQAYILSHGGTNFSPWSTYNSGAYQQYVNTSATPDNTGVGGGDYGGPDTSGQGYGSAATTGDPSLTYSAPSTFAPGGGSTGGTGSGTSGTPSGTGLGQNVQVGVQPGFLGDLNSWISGAETAVGNQVKSIFKTMFGEAANWFLRGVVIFIAVVILLVALWRLTDPEGKHTQALMAAAA